MAIIEFGYMLHNSKAPSLHGDWCTPPKNNIFSSFSWLQPVKARYVNKVQKNEYPGKAMTTSHYWLLPEDRSQCLKIWIEKEVAPI